MIGFPHGSGVLPGIVSLTPPQKAVQSAWWKTLMSILTENVAKDTSKGSLFDCQENASHYTYYCLHNQCEY